MKTTAVISGCAVSLALCMVCVLCMPPRVSAQQYDTRAVIDSVRKDGIVTLIFDSRPPENFYYMIHEGRVIGSVSINEIRRYTDAEGARFRITAAYSIVNQADAYLLRAGLEIGLKMKSKEAVVPDGESSPVEIIEYRKTILTLPDEREMVLVPEGKFIFGSNDGNRDEYPEAMIFLPAFYMDRTEVSNDDYRRYMKSSNAAPPVSWKDGVSADRGEYPVIVTYYEAEKYARWAKKRLPTEEEWEKTARGQGFRTVIEGINSYIIREPVRYPWGNTFAHERLNGREYWDVLIAGAKGNAGKERGLMPVMSFNKTGASPYGALNMAGNAMEWTSSWYAAYKGNKFRDRRFGRQFKVLRGGAWFSSRDEVRSTHRQIGGAPNLYMDAIGGFRCARDPQVTDRIK